METGAASAHTLVGAYAMDAVSDSDRAGFEQHLAECRSCREEIRELREATARLAVAAAVVPRPELKARALQAVTHIRQLPPVSGEAGATAPGAQSRQRRRWPTGRWLTGRGLRKASRGWRQESAAAPGSRRTLVPWLAAAGGAVLVAVAMVLAVNMHGAQHRLDQARRRSEAVASVLGAADAAMLTARVSTGGSATVVMSHVERKLVFTAAGLRVLPAAQRYELWLMEPSGKKPAGMLPAAQAGRSGPMVISGLSAGDRIGMTVEPARGTPDPTSPPVLMLSLSSG
jgi:hypothetical protein